MNPIVEAVIRLSADPGVRDMVAGALTGIVLGLLGKQAKKAHATRKAKKKAHATAEGGDPVSP